jgi:hypothetical protein
VAVEAYADHVGALVRLDASLGPDEAGMFIESTGKRFICVNANDRIERQRFTICHEVAHIFLGLPSTHVGLPAWSYKRPPEEVFCDLFAAELLLPSSLFQPIAESSTVSISTVEDLAARFLASFTATGSRFAQMASGPCAFVLSENGRIRHAARSKILRDGRAWIAPKTSIPKGSVSDRTRAGTMCGPEEIDAEVWFHNWERGGTVMEEARHLEQWDQTLTLLWFEDEELPPLKPTAGEPRPLREDEEELGLQELDGQLRWPSKKRRR